MKSWSKAIGALIAASALSAVAVRQLSSGPAGVATASVESAPVEGCPAPPLGQPSVPFAGEDMVAICADVYLEQGTTAAERDFVRRGYAEAARLVVNALGPFRSEPPVVIYCKSDSCQLYFTGPTRRSWSLPPGEQRKGATFVVGDRHTIIINDIYSKGIKVAAHEMTHVEFRARRRGQFLPAWFNEGAATWVGGEPDCDADLPDGIDDLVLLDWSTTWNAYTDAPEKLQPTYCQARREVATWVRHHEEGALASLLDAVGEGEAFEDVYGNMRTQ